MPYESWAIVFHVVCSKCNPIFMILVLKCYQNRNLWQIDIAEFSEIGLCVVEQRVVPTCGNPRLAIHEYGAAQMIDL